MVSARVTRHRGKAEEVGSDLRARATRRRGKEVGSGTSGGRNPRAGVDDSSERGSRLIRGGRGFAARLNVRRDCGAASTASFSTINAATTRCSHDARWHFESEHPTHVWRERLRVIGIPEVLVFGKASVIGSPEVLVFAKASVIRTPEERVFMNFCGSGAPTLLVPRKARGSQRTTTHAFAKPCFSGRRVGLSDRE